MSESFLWPSLSIKSYKMYSGKKTNNISVRPWWVAHTCVPASLWYVVGCKNSVNGIAFIDASFLKIMIHIWDSFEHRRNGCLFNCVLTVCLATILEWLRLAFSVRFRLITALGPLMICSPPSFWLVDDLSSSNCYCLVFLKNGIAQ